MEDPTKQAVNNFRLADVSGSVPPDGTAVVAKVSFPYGTHHSWVTQCICESSGVYLKVRSARSARPVIGDNSTGWATSPTQMR